MKTNTINIIFAYFIFVLVISTTPLAIKWSTVDIDFISGATFRIILASLFAVSLCFFWYKKLPIDSNALKVYFASSISIYGALMLLYYGSQFISSGLVSVIFGLNPMVTNWIATKYYQHEQLSVRKALGGLFGIAGLGYIFNEHLHFGEQAIYGFLAIFGAVVAHSLSSIWVKHINVKLSALTVTTGGLIISLPMFLVTFFIFSPPLPEQVSTRTIWVIVYLGIMGSVIGLIAYFYVLETLKASTVALGTLISPVFALYLGHLFNNETISFTIWVGTALVLTGLLIHQSTFDVLLKEIQLKLIKKTNSNQ